MKSKEDILAKYYTQGPDGMPEIAADGLLKAMEEYREQAEEAAFNAAKAYEDDVIGGKDLFATYAEYKASLQAAIPPPPEPSEAENIQLMADSILEMFIPHDKSITTLSFDIRSNGKGYTVNYTKGENENWAFTGYNPNPPL
ncbi:hypothetical protein [Mucilaginibacter pedocola]|uniref:Uncharacterized protein n=1 Tax=Mucilaginibacter pedocola TaxID=1792845 RepID=A0A1S9PJE8_9SPHI|nr:hypothetical protein [Mucilaginibacter pedocola]OOQ61090.1 hypothetical protein BC343_21840 [Mucilaginibacter pedocola]